MGRSSLTRHATAIAATVLAVAARLALDPALGEGAIAYITLFPTLVFVGWYAGLRSAVCFLLLSGLGVVFLLPPLARGSMMTDSRAVVGLGVDLAAGAACAALGHAIHRARRRAEVHALEARLIEEQLVSMFAVSSAGMARVDLVTRRFLCVNPALCAITGYDEADLLGMTVDQLNHPDDQRRDRDLHERLVRGENPYAIEKRYVRKDGTTAWVQVTGDVVRDADGRPIRAFAIIQDISVRREAEEALRRSEGEYRSLFDSSGVANAEARLDTGQFVRANRAFLELTGYDADELLGKTFLEITHPDDRDRNLAVIGPLLEGLGEGFEIEKRYVRKDGRIVWVHLAGTLVRQAPDRPTRMLASAHDITARREAEDQARRSEDRLRRMADSLPQMIFLADGARSITYANRFAHEYTGLTDLRGARWAECIHPDDRGRVQDVWREAVRSGMPYETQCRYLRADGAYRWMISRGLPIRDASGGVVEWVGACTDIDEMKRLQDDLRESEERFRRAADATGALVYEVDLLHEGRAEAHGLERLIGEEESGAELSSAWWHARIHPDDLPARLASLEDCLANTASVSHKSSYRIRHGDGSWRHVEDAAQIVRAENGRPARLVGAIVDVTARKQAEETLEEADRRKNEFLAMLAHELRNPLSAIRSAVTLLRLEGLAQTDLRWSRDVIDRQVTHLARLVDDLLDVSRITRGKVRLRRQPLDLRDVVGRAVESGRHLLEAKRHEFVLFLPESPLHVDADAARLEQVVGNLLSNATKYTEDRGHLALAARREGNEAVIHMRDDGVGIPAGQLHAVFDLFTQVDATLDRSRGGLGIGLTLVKTLVEMHGGSVSAASGGPGQGSEFVVRLPLLTEPDEPRASLLRQDGPEPAPTLDPVARRILVVDDNLDAARGISSLLEVAGHDVRTAHDGPTAVEIARAFHPQVVLLDIGLPGMDGYQVARALRDDDRARGAVLVAVSGYDQDQCRSEEAGFDHHLKKPIDLQDIRALLGLATAPRETGES